MAFQPKLSSTLLYLRIKQKIRTLINHPQKVFRNYLLAFEDVVGLRISWIDRLAFNMYKKRLHRLMNRESSLNDILCHLNCESVFSVHKLVKC